MKEDTELEEGEAFYYKDDDEDNIDPDSFSYIVRSYFNFFFENFKLNLLGLCMVWMINKTWNCICKCIYVFDSLGAIRRKISMTKAEQLLAVVLHKLYLHCL